MERDLVSCKSEFSKDVFKDVFVVVFNIEVKKI